MSDNNTPVRFALEFTDQIYAYLKDNKKPSISQFANKLKVTVDTLHAWADKKIKDKDGKLTDQLARPKFHEALKILIEAQEIWEKKDKEQLNAKQEMFCQLYASDREFFANGTQSYIEAYGINTSKPNAYNAARSSASDLLSNPNILRRINEILEGGNLNDTFVDKQLEFIITQNADFSSKIAAIREYNKIKTRIVDKSEIDLTSDGKPLGTIVGFNYLQPEKPKKADGTNNTNDQAKL